jgi:hypothetical protein
MKKIVFFYLEFSVTPTSQGNGEDMLQFKTRFHLIAVQNAIDPNVSHIVGLTIVFRYFKPVPVINT